MAARKTSSAPTRIWTYHATIDGSDELVFQILRVGAVVFAVRRR